jgi:membrane-bound ClpP family serine protease
VERFFDAPAFVVVAFTLASALLLVEVALPTFGPAGISGLGLAGAGTLALARQDGELQASQKLGEAADVIARSPGALQLRQLQTMVEIAAERNSTIIFPIPIELLEALRPTAR